MEPRPSHRDPQLLGLVFVGGTAGTAARATVGEVLPTAAGSWPWSTFLVNLFGAFVLGLLLETLVRRGPDEGRRRALRLGMGTGFLGGFTTYSAFAVEVVRMPPGSAALYAASSVLLGALAAATGCLLARRIPRAGAS